MFSRLKDKHEIVLLEESSLVFKVLFWFIVFGVVAFFWGIFFITGLIDETLNLSNGPFLLLGLIVGFQFQAWLRQNINSYTSGVKLVRQFLNKIRHVTRLFGILTTPTEENKAILLDIRIILWFMTDVILNHFFGEETKPSKTSDNQEKRASQERVRLEIFKEDQLYAPTNIIYLENSKEAFTKRIIQLKNIGSITEFDVDRLLTLLNPIDELIHDIEMGILITTPKILTFWLSFALAVYLFLLPLLMWPTFGFFLLIIFPVLVIVVVGFWITRRWLGNPFEKQLKSNQFKFNEWRESTMNLISEKIENEIEIVVV